MRAATITEPAARGHGRADPWHSNGPMKRPDTQPSADNARIDELEARLALQDHSILELSDEIYRQQREIADLERKLRELTERVRTLADAASTGPSGPIDERPPHY